VSPWSEKRVSTHHGFTSAAKGILGSRLLSVRDRMRFGLLLCFLFVLAIFTACGPTPEERAIQRKAKSLVSKRATTNEVINTFGQSPIHIFTHSEVLGYLQRSPGYHIWETMSKYPETYSFPMPGGEVYIYFDDSHSAVGYYLNIQL
jgi:hypothetical protein